MNANHNTERESHFRKGAPNHGLPDFGYLDRLPRYSGISHPEKVGPTVDECAQFIARLAAIKRQCVFIASARMPDIKEWELKVALARWIWEDATNYQLLEHRVTELRSNKAAIAKILQYQLGDFLTEILHSPGSLELCVGLFEVLSPAFCKAIEHYLAETQPLVDQPTVRILKQILLEEREHLALGSEFLEVLKQEKNGEKVGNDWKVHFEHFLTAANGVSGRDALPDGFSRPTPRASDAFNAIHEFERDRRFTKIIPKIVPLAVRDDELLRMMWTRREELCVAETVAVILYEWGDDLPTEAIVDLARQCWDETRHTLFGQVALEQSGYPLPSLESWVGFGMHALAESPQKAFAHLSLAIEARAMAHPGGKRGEWEYCRDVARHPLMSNFQDFDWADEISHVKYGRKWIIEHYFGGKREPARKLADDSVRDRVLFYSKYGFRDPVGEQAPDGQ